MASGRPILIHAPPYAYVVQYARENALAHIVDREDPLELAKAIRKLTTDVPHSRRLVANALRRYYKHHDARVNARRFAKVIASI
jgi:glycosyltransferase involved in cell wall biosynthesis